ncbi:hypothetical protein ACFLIM_36310 [Nonomuraea sp. M3C6]|uniref:WG containing repeat-containing protein n=1 Tax=Nonomuraea marmarensis TaxID=3351344 RepID=A0ABW7AQX7_9ACTN
MRTFIRSRLRRSATVSVVVGASLTLTAVAAAAPALSTRQAGPGGLMRVAAHSSVAPRSVTPVFVLDKGRLTAFDIPFGEFGGDAVTIDDRGQIAGSYYNAPAATCLRGFLRDHQGRFRRIDFPAPGTTQLIDINDRGQLVGNHRPSSGTCSGTEPLRGFLRDERGRFTTIRVPGAKQVQALGINNRGQIVGDYRAADGTTHGYLRDRGRITTIDGPVGTAGASVLDINDHGQMVGVYLDKAGGLHAFSLRGGRYTSIDAPNVTYTFPFGVNNRGQIAGLTAAALPLGVNSDAHGFALRDGAGGPFTRIDVPGAVGGTAVFDINNTGALVGVYANPGATSGPPPASAMPGIPGKPAAAQNGSP